MSESDEAQAAYFGELGRLDGEAADLKRQLQQAQERIQKLQQYRRNQEISLGNVFAKLREAQEERDREAAYAADLEAALACDTCKHPLNHIDHLKAERDAAIEQVEGMQREGCAAVGLVENIFNGLTSSGVPDDPMLKEMADACAKLLVDASQCDHKEQAEAAEALAELRGSALVLVCANIRQGTWDKMSIPARVRILEALPAEAHRRDIGGT